MDKGDVKISSEALQTDVRENEGRRESLPARRAFKMHFFRANLAGLPFLVELRI